MNYKIRLFQIISILATVVLAGTEPNYVRVTTYASDPNGTKVHEPKTVIKYSDGLGREIEVVEKINKPDENEGYSSIITGTTYDAAGRPSVTFKPAGVKNSDGYVEDLKGSAQSYYKTIFLDDGAYCFSETHYYPDPLGRTKAIGYPGEKHSINYDNQNPENEHFPRIWYLRTKIGVSGHANFTQDGFLKPPASSDTKIEHYLDDLQKPSNGGNFANPTHYLTITRDGNGNFTQEIIDIFGRTVRTASSASDRLGSSIVSVYEYDILGNVKKETAPKSGSDILIGNTIYEYNTLSQVVWKETPDAGKVEYEYDDAGRLVKYIDANLRTEGAGYSIRYEYDAHGRLVFTCKSDETAGWNVQPKVINIYDDAVNASKYFGSNIPELLTKEVKNTRGRLVASVAFTEAALWSSGADEYDFSGDPIVIDLFSYDNEGRVREKYKKVPGMPVQQWRYNYDLQGKMVQSSSVMETGKSGRKWHDNKYKYDAEGRLASLECLRYQLSFDYEPHGVLKKKAMERYYNKIGHVDYYYTIRNWLKSSYASGDGGGALFNQTLDYSGNYNGNISKLEYNWNATGPDKYEKEESMEFTYDKVNRLTKAAIKRYDENDIIQTSYAYDNAGRITHKKEEWQNTQWGPYLYESGNSRLKSISNSNRQSKNDKRNYVYDSNGNTVVDRSKNLTIEYDWRNLPVRFNFHKDLDHVSDDVKPSDIPGLRTNVISYVRMAYDAGGQRVLKQEFRD